MNVIKRSGEEVPFDFHKILNAIKAVNNDCSGYYDQVDDQTATLLTDTVI